jgi:hypothetical protein
VIDVLPKESSRILGCSAAMSMPSSAMACTRPG